MTGRKAAVVQRLADEAFNGRNWDVFDALHDPSGLVHRAGESVTPAAIKDVHRDRLQAFPDLRWTIERQFEDGEFVITHATWRGTHLGTYLGIQATGETVSGEVVAIRRVVDGRIVETWAVADTLRVLEQIGGGILQR